MRKHYTAKFKAQIVQELLKEEQSFSQIASEHGVHLLSTLSTHLNQWKTIALKRLPDLFSQDDQTAAKLKAAHEEKIEALYAEIGRLTTQLTWLKKKSGLEPDEG